MPAVQIKIDQAGAPVGVPGQAREDLVLSLPITLAAIGGPYLNYQWSFPAKAIDVVAGVRSSIAFASSTAPTTTCSPVDIQGTYLVRLAVDSGSGLGATTDDNASITFYAGAALNPDPTQYPRRTPAIGETIEHNVPDVIDPDGNKDGWGRERARWDAAAAKLMQKAYAATSTWHLSQSGSASGTGTSSGDPIPKEELSRRLRGVRLTIAGFMTLQWDAAGDPTGSLNITWDTPPGVQVVIAGVRTSGATGQLTTWTVIDKSTTPVRYGFKDSALADDGWNARLGQQILMTSGAAAGVVLAVKHNQNADTPAVPKTCGVATPYLTPYSFPFDGSGFAVTPPANSDHYVMQSLTRLGGVIIEGSFDPQSSVTYPLLFKDIELANPAVGVLPAKGVAFLNCTLDFLFTTSGDYTIFGGSLGGIFASRCAITAIGCAIQLAISINNAMFLTLQDCVLEASSDGQLFISDGGVCYVQGADGLQIWGVTGANAFAAIVKNLSILFLKGALSGANPRGIEIVNGGRVPCNTPPTLKATADLLLDIDNAIIRTPAQGWGDANFADRKTGSGIFTAAVGEGIISPAWTTSNAWALRTGTVNVLVIDELALMNTGAATTVQLPLATVAMAGHRVRLKDATGTASTHNITVATQGGQTVDGGAPAAITTNFGSSMYTVVATGGVSSWILG